MNARMNRRHMLVGTPKDLEKSEKDYWAKATVGERLRTITYLRECFYGPKATTGRLQRFYKVFKRV
jgi:hypothetical protein